MRRMEVMRWVHYSKIVDHKSLLQDAEKENKVLNIKGRGVSERPSLNMCHNWNRVTTLIHFFYFL